MPWRLMALLMWTVKSEIKVKNLFLWLAWSLLFSVVIINMSVKYLLKAKYVKIHLRLTYTFSPMMLCPLPWTLHSSKSK